jgi:two-component system nitrate/nitrite response regulator NarL
MIDCRALLVCEKRLLRDGLREMLQRSRISVIGEASDMPGILAATQMQADPELVICHIASQQNPDTGLELVYGLRRHFARTKLVVLADACTRSLLSSFIGADVNAILLTSISCEMLHRSLDLVLFDHRLFPAEIMSLISDNALSRLPLHATPVGRAILTETGSFLAQAHDSSTAAGIAPQPGPVLSRREHQIIDCLVCGLPNKRIARKLNITEATVKVYVKGLLRKIKVSNRTQVAIWALQQQQLPESERSYALIDAHVTSVEPSSEPIPLSG